MASSPRRVSVVIPTYNRARLVEEAIASVLRQTMPVHEVIVVDDGSTDATRELIRGHDGPITLVTQDHLGAAAARNRGLARATGDWVAFLDSDDIWTPSKLEKQIEYLDRHPHCGLVHTGYYEFGDRVRVVPAPARFVQADYRIEYLLFAEDWICPSSALVRKATSVSFREWAPPSEDVILFADLLRAGVQFGYVNEALVGYRMHSASLMHEPTAQVLILSSQHRWLLEAFGSEPDEQRRLLNNLSDKVVHAISQAKWSRAWETYWQLRGWLTEHWPSDAPRPKVLDERIYAPLVYEVKDKIEKFLPRLVRQTIVS
jgi:glycosyltransferase involved in cell wall biosynthesis